VSSIHFMAQDVLPYIYVEKHKISQSICLFKFVAAHTLRLNVTCNKVRLCKAAVSLVLL
jgi:hypothetical protein